MIVFRTSLATRIFLAIAGTAILIIAIMALQVAQSMRDGFAQYLLRGELTRFDDLVQALVAAHDADAPGWPDFAADPQAWNAFVRAHFTPGSPPPAPPPDMPPELPPDMQTAALPGLPPPGGRPGGENRVIGERLMLLGPDGARLAGTTDRSGLFERRAICTQAGCPGGSLLGHIGLNAPLTPDSASDAFFLRRQYAALAVAALIAVAVSAAAAFLVSRKILRPIRQLEQGAKKMASGDYSVRIGQNGTDELGQLIGHYNVLAATLERTERAERAWISNTSHELQTPLATLRAQIEAVQDGVRQADAETLAGMHAAMMRLSRLVQDIKLLSHSREGGLTTAFQHEDLAAIAQEVAQAARPQLAGKGIALDLDLPGTAPLACDRLQLCQVIDNLLQNAIRYTDAPGRVRLRVRDVGKTVQLVVDDTPPAPSDADLPRLFDRFFRAESSRSRAFGGSGLGLSVCRAIVTAHGGTIAAQPSDIGGLRITVSLPKAPA